MQASGISFQGLPHEFCRLRRFRRLRLLATFSGMLWARQLRASREAYIRDFVLPKGLFEALRAHHPQLD